MTIGRVRKQVSFFLHQETSHSLSNIAQDPGQDNKNKKRLYEGSGLLSVAKYTETPETQNDWLIELVGFNQSLIHKSYVDV